MGTKDSDDFAEFRGKRTWLAETAAGTKEGIQRENIRRDAAKLKVNHMNIYGSSTFPHAKSRPLAGRLYQQGHCRETATALHFFRSGHPDHAKSVF